MKCKSLRGRPGRWTLKFSVLSKPGKFQNKIVGLSKTLQALNTALDYYVGTCCVNDPGGTLGKFRWGCAACFLKPCTLFQSKNIPISDMNNIKKVVSATKHTQFQTVHKTLPDFRPKWLNLYPISNQKGSKTTPFGAAHTYMVCAAHKGFPPPPAGNDQSEIALVSNFRKSKELISKLKWQLPPLT